MGLGGLTRDSIIGLNNLVHDDDDDDEKRCHNRRHTGDNNVLSGSWNNGSKKGSDEFLFLEEDDAVTHSESQASFETSLNDGLSPKSSPSPPRSSRSTVYSKVSATNSRSLDSYRTNDPITSSSPSGAQAAHYQGFQYEGYSDYYSDEYSTYDDYSYSIGSRGGEKKNVFCCLFAPWAQPKVIEAEDQSIMSGLEEDQNDGKQVTGPPSPPGKETESKPSARASASGHVESTPTLTPTPSLIEKFPAVTSLGIGTMPTEPLTFADSEEVEPSDAPQPKKELSDSPGAPVTAAEFPTTPHHMLSGRLSDSASTDGTLRHSDEKKQEEEDISSRNAGNEAADEEDKGPPPTKGILKVKRCSLSLSNISRRNSTKKPTNEAETSPSNKRHLFPTYEAKKSQTGAEGKPKAINFNPMARVLTIPSRKDIPYHQKARVWWQKCDYDEFKKTGRIISKAMECGGSEIWLASSNAWGNRAAESQRTKQKEENAGNQGDSEEYNKALSKYINEDEKKDDEENGGDTGEKWWCKFGHSRRGLEHIASSTEGKARQQSVLLAIRMVMEEQKRQRAARTKDPNKLRNVAMQYTSWARDLSLAAGSADAEAVASGFDPTATCRARHFAKRLSVLNENDAAGGGVARAVTSQILDANTHSTPTTTAKKSLKDNINLQSEESLSKRAKGFIPGGRKNPAAEFLNGMGGVTHRTTVDVSYGI